MKYSQSLSQVHDHIGAVLQDLYSRVSRRTTYGVDLDRVSAVTNGFPCAMAGGLITELTDSDGDTSGVTPEATSSDDDDGGGDAESDPDRRYRKYPHLSSGKHRDATATDGALLASRNSVSPSAGTSAHIFPPLEAVSRPTVPTEQAAFYLLRRPQTLRAWACNENGPIRPIRIGNRLGWKVADIKAALGV